MYLGISLTFPTALDLDQSTTQKQAGSGFQGQEREEKISNYHSKSYGGLSDTTSCRRHIPIRLFHFLE